MQRTSKIKFHIDHVTPTPHELHWLPIQARLNFKICHVKFSSNVWRVFIVETPCIYTCGTKRGQARLIKLQLVFGERCHAVSH